MKKLKQLPGATGLDTSSSKLKDDPRLPIYASIGRVTNMAANKSALNTNFKGHFMVIRVILS